MADLLPEDADGGELSRDGRVMEMLSDARTHGTDRSEIAGWVWPY